MEPALSSPSPVSPLVDLLPLSLGPDSATAMGDEMTVLDNAETATYTHTLTVTGMLGGDYQCNVSNSKPSHAVASLIIECKKLYTNQFNLKL